MQDLPKIRGFRQPRNAKQSVTLLWVLTLGHLVNACHDVIRQIIQHITDGMRGQSRERCACLGDPVIRFVARRLQRAVFVK